MILNSLNHWTLEIRFSWQLPSKDSAHIRLCEAHPSNGQQHHHEGQLRIIERHFDFCAQ